MLEKAYREGKLRAIGISNFPVEKIQEVLDQCQVVPAVMPVECHPYYPEELVKPFCDEKGIALQAWYPLGHGNTDMLHDEVFVSLAEKYHKSTVQIILRWHVQMGFAMVPGSKSFEHIKENGEMKESRQLMPDGISCFCGERMPGAEGIYHSIKIFPKRRTASLIMVSSMSE